MKIRTESLHDIPLIIEFCKKLKIDQIVNEITRNHGNQKGLSNGLIAIGWIAHILTKGNHLKSPVQEWAISHKMALQSLLENKLSNTDFNDDRLSRFLDKLADDDVWHQLENLFYRDSFSLLNLTDTDLKTIKIDSTSAYGYHEEGELIRYGYSKDHRPDLPQLKLMVSVEGSTGYQIASDTVAGNINDDVLYIPIIERTRKIVDTKGSLICGDSKMSSISVRTNIVKNNEFYLTPLQINNCKIKKEFNEYINDIVNGEREAQLISDDSNSYIGGGYEFIRECINDGIKWKERVLVVKSNDFAEQEKNRLKKRLGKLMASLEKQSSKACKEEKEAKTLLQEKIKKLIEKEELAYLLDLKIDVQYDEKEHLRTEKRDGKTRAGSYKIKTYKAFVANMSINKQKFKEIENKLGWRLYVTNSPESILPFRKAYCYFRQTMYVIEIGFHVLKDYLQISPLFVRDERQIKGLTRLLMISLKILTLMTATIRANMKKTNQVLQGLYAGQPAKKHSKPTAQSVLQYFCRKEITLIGINLENHFIWKVEEVPDLCKTILSLLGINENIYEELPEKLLKWA